MENFWEKFSPETLKKMIPKKKEKINLKKIRKFVIIFSMLIFAAISANAENNFDFNLKNEISIENFDAKYDYKKWTNLIETKLAEKEIVGCEIKLKIFEEKLRSGKKIKIFEIGIERFSKKYFISAGESTLEFQLGKIVAKIVENEPKIVLDDSWDNEPEFIINPQDFKKRADEIREMWKLE